MKRLTLPASVAACVHALIFLTPMPHAPGVISTQPPHGPPIAVTMTVRHAQPSHSVNSPPTPEPVKPRRQMPRPVAERPTPTAVEPARDEFHTTQGLAPGPVTSPEAAVADARDFSPGREEASGSAFRDAGDGASPDDRPTPLHSPDPKYPNAAIRRGYEGVVLLDILVTGNGEVADVRIQKSSGHGVLDRSAADGVKRWRFSATGRKAPSWVTLPVRFELKS